MGDEGEFFRKQEQEAIEKLRVKRARGQRLEALAEACGFRDENVLGTLVDLGVDAETLAALAMAPLVAVAWADGEVAERERAAILEVAEARGVRAGTPARELLDSWLSAQFSPKLFDAWVAYMRASCAELGPDERAALKSQHLEGARDVAAAAGGVLGVRSISREERSVLERLEAAFQPSISRST